MDLSQTEILAGVLVIACLFLLWCQLRCKKSDNMKNKRTNFDGIKWNNKEGMGGAGNFDGVHLSKGATVGYIKQPTHIEGLDNDKGPVGSLADLDAPVYGSGNIPWMGNHAKNVSVPEARFLNAHAHKWQQDMSVQIDPKYATHKDGMNGSLQFGHGIVNTGTNWSNNKDKLYISGKNIGHGNDILTKTDFMPEYGYARGSVSI